MSFTKYLGSFLVFSLLMGLIFTFVFMHDEMRKAADLVLYSYIGFSMLSLLTFTMSKLLESKRYRATLLHLSFSNMLMKIIFTAVILYIYYTYKNPETGLFIIPFIITYIGFTIFETYYFNSETK